MTNSSSAKSFFLGYIDENVYNKPRFKEWIMRAWFNPSKHSQKSWFDATVTTTNVVEHLSNNLKVFPYTVQQLVEIWNIIPVIQHGLGVSKEDDGESTQEEENESAIYKKGEKTLSEIGAEIGHVSATMIKKIGDGAEIKLNTLYKNKCPSDNSSIDDEISLNKSIDNAQLETSTKFAKILKDSNGDMEIFFSSLVKEQIITSNEIDLISGREKTGLSMLCGMESDIIEDILLEDIGHENNRFKTFQNAVSKTIYPNKKRGRPRKELITEETLLSLPTESELMMQEKEIAI